MNWRDEVYNKAQARIIMTYRFINEYFKDVFDCTKLIFFGDDPNKQEEVRREARQSFAALIMLTGVALILFGAFLHIRSSLTPDTERPAEVRSPDKIVPYG